MPRDETQHLGYGISIKGKQVDVPFSILRLDLVAWLRFMAGLIALLWWALVWASG